MKAINISICRCGKFLDKHSWRPVKDVREVIMQKIRETMPKAKIKFEYYSLPEKHKEKKDIQTIVEFKGQVYKPVVIVKMAKCNLCEREGTKYFEAILQIRSRSEPVLKESVEYLQERISGLRQRGVFINKVERFEDGFDLYLTSNKLAQVLGRELLDKFGGGLKVSPRLFSKNKQTSKELYRVNVFIELPGFTRGDYMVVDDHVFLVDKLGRKIKITEAVSGSSRIVDYLGLDYSVLKRQQAYVSKTYPHLEVINPHDYQSSMIKNKPRKDLVLGEKANVVIHKGIYAVD
ncbi:hypothetical protein JW826_01240 [Candidatus Woesearchaeota archaeon]|nr:hypothetical protein [Candidatus Woesearchaeota archaeon]